MLLPILLSPDPLSPSPPLQFQAVGSLPYLFPYCLQGSEFSDLMFTMDLDVLQAALPFGCPPPFQLGGHETGCEFELSCGSLDQLPSSANFFLLGTLVKPFAS